MVVASTDNLLSGAVVPMPTRPLVVSRLRMAVPAAFWSWRAVAESAAGKIEFADMTILGVVSWVVKVGEVPKTKLPVPVSSDKESIKYWEAAEVVKRPPVVVKTPLEAVRFEKVMLPEEVMPDKPEASPITVISQVAEWTATVFDPPPRVTAALEVPVLMLVA